MLSSSSSKAKKFTLKNVFDGFRGTVGSQNRQDADIEETLRSEHYLVTKTVRHGFPFQPTALAYDPVQHLLAIGNKSGCLRIIGQPGVDSFCNHDTDVAITQIIFMVNEGTLVTVRNDDHLHLWDFRQKQPKIVHSLKFQREKISKCHLPFQSKWLYVGTERGNVHVVNVETFTCSGYIINWNKAIELSRKSHPGPVVHLSDNPCDPSKLLIGFESGALVLWDLKTKSAEYRYSSQEALRSISWHNEGKQFMCSHSDGSLSTWNVRTPHRPISVISPHAKSGPEDTLEVCKPIAKVEWRSARTGEPIIIFSGGLSYDKGGRTPCLTVMAGKNTTVLEMEHTIIDFISLCDTPWANDLQEPNAIVVLLENDLVVIDLNTSGYPCFENPYPMDLHESPVTACQYYANCPMDIIPALYSTGKNQKKSGFSEKPWPIKGGSWGARGTSYPEIIITGHADGSLKFWDASAVTLQFLYKLKTAKVFEKPKKPSQDKDDDLFAIQMIFLCLESRNLCVAGPTHCVLFRFSKQEASIETVSLEFTIVYEVHDDLDSPEFDFSKPCAKMLGQNSSSLGSHSSTASDNTKPETVTSVKVRSGSHRWGPGFLPELVCILCSPEGESQGNITVMSLNSSYGLLAFGNESGLAIVDYLQKACLLNLGTPDLYGSMDPYQRTSKSPHTKKPPGEGLAQGSEDSMSPSVDQSGFYQILSHGNNKSGETSPTSPLTPNSAPGYQAFVPNVGWMMAQALKVHQPLLTADLFPPGQTQFLSDPDSVTDFEAEPQLLKDDHHLVDAMSVESSDMIPHVSSTESAPSQSPGLVKSSRPLNLFEKDKSKIKSKHKTVNQLVVSCTTKASSQSKYGYNQQRSLVHQQALDLSIGGSSECSTYHAQDTYNMAQQQDATSPPTTPLTPMILLPRSASEINGICGSSDAFFGSDVSGNLDLLHPTSCLKPKSISTGDIMETQNSVGESPCLLLSSGKKEPDGKIVSFTTNVTESNSERKCRDLLRKSSSDSQISLSDKTTALKVTHHRAENQRKNWLMNQMRRISKKKRNVVHEMEMDREVKSLDAKARDKSAQLSSNCNALESKELFPKFPEKEDEDDFIVKGPMRVKSPEDNSNFFRRVSLKIKSFGSRKHSNEDEDKEVGAAAVDKLNQQLQERQHKVTIDVLDLSDDTARKHSSRKMYLSEVMQSRKSFDKTDATFCRSRSSSISSLDNVSKEAIQSLVFADSYTSKQDTETSPCLWVGTSLGSVIVIALILQREQRLSQPVIVSPSGSLYRMKGAIVCMSFLDFKGCLIPAMCDQWKDNRDIKDVNEKSSTKTTGRQMSLSTSKSKICSSPSTEINSDKQFAIICSEKQARVIALPSQTCAFKVKVTEVSFVVKSEVVGLRESVCLMCYVANGHIMAFSLPSLKPLFDADFLPLIDYRVARTFCFSNSGHAMFMCSPTEIQKITYSAEIAETLNEMLGDLYIPNELPEAPKQSFLKSLFSTAAATLDREELFGEASGKASKSLVKHIPGMSSMQQMHQQTSVSVNEFSRARMLVNERREKLGEVEDRTEKMMNTSEQLSSAAQGIKLKYKDKKWYQF